MRGVSEVSGWVSYAFDSDAVSKLVGHFSVGWVVLVEREVGEVSIGGFDGVFVEDVLL